MPTDIVIHIKGLLTFNEMIYKDIRNHSIDYNDKVVTIEFNYTGKTGKRKGKDIRYHNTIPINNLYRVGVRTYE